MNIALLALLSCPQPKLISLNIATKLNDYDYSKFNELKKSHKCAIYYNDAPCLKTVIKVEDHMYRVMCGVAN